MLSLSTLRICTGFQIPTYGIYLEDYLGIPPEKTGYILMVSSCFYFVFSILVGKIQ